MKPTWFRVLLVTLSLVLGAVAVWMVVWHPGDGSIRQTIVGIVLAVCAIGAMVEGTDGLDQ